MTLIPVPLVLQTGLNANQFERDCAVAGAKGIIQRYQGWALPVDMLARRTDLYTNPAAGLTVTQVKALLATFGIDSIKYPVSSSSALSQIKIAIDSGSPVLVAVSFDKEAIKHMVTVIGISKQGNWYINDPARGRLTWSNRTLLDRMMFDPPAWVLQPLKTFTGVSSIIVHRRNAPEAYVRATPGKEGKVIGTLKDGERVTFRPSEIVALEGHYWIKSNRGCSAVDIL